MIQRIQSVYFLLAGIFPAILFFVPVFSFENAGQSHVLSAMTFGFTGSPDLHTPWGVVVFTTLSVVLPIFAIFKFKNRPLQIKLAKYTILVHTLLAMTFAVYAWTYINGFAQFTSFGIGAGLFFWILAIVLIILAKRAVKRDEDLVRAADRIR